MGTTVGSYRDRDPFRHMVTKITVFEPHFDGAQFGPASIGPEVDAREPDTSVANERVEDESENGSTGPRRTVVVLAAALSLLAVVGALAARRMMGSPSDEESRTVSTADEIPVE